MLMLGRKWNFMSFYRRVVDVEDLFKKESVSFSKECLLILKTNVKSTIIIVFIIKETILTRFLP
jgi:hypothetical protein